MRRRNRAAIARRSGVLARRRSHIGWKFAALSSASLREKSARMYFAKSSGVPVIGSCPSLAKRPALASSAVASLIAWLSHVTILAGRFFGPQKPYHDANSRSFMLLSAAVG